MVGVTNDPSLCDPHHCMCLSYCMTYIVVSSPSLYDPTLVSRSPKLSNRGVPVYGSWNNRAYVSEHIRCLLRSCWEQT